MFNKGSELDKKKILGKAIDTKNDPLTRLKHFKTLIEHLNHNDSQTLFDSHSGFIYQSFIETFPFDCKSYQSTEDLGCLLFILEKILVYCPNLIKERQHFYSISSVIQNLLDQKNTSILRQEGVRIFVVWYQILSEERNADLQTVFTTLVPGELLQVFVLNSTDAFLTSIHNQEALDKHVEMCKKIMNIYRFMVMKIFMNKQTWNELINAMFQITEHLFPTIPPEKKEMTIGGRIAPAYFQTFIVSWIRANLYVEVSPRMWSRFHMLMGSLVRWRELIQEWSATMGSLTRVLVKHVYGLNLNDTSAARCVLLGGNVRGWTPQNSIIMWRRMLGLFGNINKIEDPENHLIAVKCLAIILRDFIKTLEDLKISLHNKSNETKIIPPYTYTVAWLLEATHLPEIYKESRLLAYKLLCKMTILGRDIEVPPQYYTAFYEALQRGLSSDDLNINASIVRNSTQILSLELPGSTYLAPKLLEKCRDIIMDASNVGKYGKLKPGSCIHPNKQLPRDQSIEILSSILALHEPISKLILIRQGDSITSPIDIESEIFQTLLDCTSRAASTDNQTRAKALSVLALQVYHEICDKNESPWVEQLFDTLLTNLQDTGRAQLTRTICDIFRLFADHSSSLVASRPMLVASLMQTICQSLVKCEATDKECVQALLLCLEDWCMSVDKEFLVTPIKIEQDNYIGRAEFSDDLLVTDVLRTLDRITNDEQHAAIELACKVLHMKLITYLGHFPMDYVGPASTSCYINELDFSVVAGSSEQESAANFITSANVILFVLNNTTVVSLINESHTNPNGPLQTVHLIVRNLCGKFSWEASCIELGSCNNNTHQVIDKENDDFLELDANSFQETRGSMKYLSDHIDDGDLSNSLSSRSSLSRDCIGDVMNFLSLSFASANGHSICSSNQQHQRKRSSAQSTANPKLRFAQAEETMIALLTNQCFQELNYNERFDDSGKVLFKISGTSESSVGNRLQTSETTKQQQATGLCMEQCRQLAQQLGYLSWGKRLKIDALAKNQRLLRELKNIDAQPSRETHKIAVIYVANGQEDKTSILANPSGSQAFENFVSGLGWDVDLSNHMGYKGGLPTNKSTGESSPYYCNASTEVMFHVSTRFPIQSSSDDESLNRKLRHLGNDEIHIVWSEHSRDYRRGIIPTEFGDVIIAIYPMLTFQGYCRIQISRKDDVPIFGPLIDNCVVHQSCLAPLVRATAINASRAKRLTLPYYQTHYEERNRLIELIVKNHKQGLSFEDFATQLYNTSEFEETSQQDFGASVAATTARC